jgi:DNA-directed RNA polymerase specialized sigma24 family protein
MNTLSRSIDRLQQSAFQLAKRQPAIDDRVRARKSSADRERVSHDGVSVPCAGDELMQVALRVLKEMPGRDREVLLRFYLHEEQPEEIQRALDITETHFRRVKSLAKRRFDELRK